MKKLLENLANMIKVKTFITIVVILVFAILALTNKIDTESVMYIVTTVVAFYFGTQFESNQK